ncbi:MAG: hypothetical protein RL065_81, partial [Bacteroidota bacterium]
MKKHLHFFVIFLFALISNQVIAQGTYCPPNIDFESGTFSKWNCFKGSVTAGAVGITSVLNYPTFANGPDTIQHVMKSSGLDTFGQFPTVCNFIPGNHFSVRIGDDQIGAICSRISYKINIPANDNNYSLTFYYAIVFQNPKHYIEAQPKFSVTVLDSTLGTSATLCSNFSIVQPQSGKLPGFISSIFSGFMDTVYYKPWTASTLDLSGMAGKTIYIQFDAADCAYGGHFGYAYIDLPMNCSNGHITQSVNCVSSTSAELVAPSGYAAYEWYDSSFANLLSNNDTLPISLSPLDTFYHYCVLKPFNNWGCNDTLKIKYNNSPSVTADFNFPTSYCANSSVYFVDNSSVNVGGVYIKKWNWNFGDMNATSNNLNTDTTQNPIHQYSALGNYTVCLIAQSNINCLLDTICKTITINRQPPTSVLSFTKDSVCGLTDTVTIYSTTTSQLGNSYHWVLDGSTQLISGSLTSNAPIVVLFKAVGSHTITLNTIPSPLDTTCITASSAQIFVKGMSPSSFISGIDSICNNIPFQLMVNNIPSTSGPSSVNCTTLSSVTAGIGNGNTFTIPSVFDGFYTEGKIQMLYTKAELNGYGFYGGIISQLSWNVISKNSTQPYQGYTIKIAPVTYSLLPIGVIDYSAPLTTVFSSSAYNSIIGSNVFQLSTPFAWNGNSNLLIQVCFDNGTRNWSSADIVTKTTMPSQGFCNWFRSDLSPLLGCDSLYPLPSFGVVASGTERPDVTFHYCNALPFSPSTTFSWTSTSGLTSTSNNISDSINTLQTYTVVVNDNGCSSSSNHTVKVVTFFNASIVKNLCGGSVFQFNGKNYTSTGIYYDTVHSSSSCDTGYVLNLTFNYNYKQSSITACSPYYFNNNWLTVSGNYLDTISSTNGCDTIVTLFASFISSNGSLLINVLCDTTTYYYHGTPYTSPGKYLVSDTIGNCVLIDTLQLVNAFSTQTFITQVGISLVANNTSTPLPSYYWFDCNFPTNVLATGNTFFPQYQASYAVIA